MKSLEFSLENNMDLEEIRRTAEEQDIELTRMLAERGRYPFSLNLYKNRSHPLLRKDSCLASYIERVYSHILKILSPEGEIQVGDLEEVVRLDREIAYRIMARTTKIGEAVAGYKHPRGLPVYIPEIEKRKKQDRIRQAGREGLKLKPEQIQKIFGLIFEETRRVEGIVAQEGRERMSSNGGIRGIETDCKELIESIRDGLIEEGKRIGGEHSVGIRETYLGGIKRYTLTLF